MTRKGPDFKNFLNRRDGGFSMKIRCINAVLEGIDELRASVMEKWTQDHLVKWCEELGFDMKGPKIVAR